MAIERLWEEIPARAFIANGQSNGTVTLESTINFRTNQKVTLTASGFDPLNLVVKRVISPTQMLLGPDDKNILSRYDLSAYTLLVVPVISAAEQNKTSIPEKDQLQMTLEREPVNARRVFQVDDFGRPFSTSNPFPVQLSDGSVNIGTVNAELEVQLTHLDDDPDLGDVYDSVRIGDGTYILKINPDGSINISLASAQTPKIINFLMPTAGSEYQLTIPDTAKRFHFNARGNSKILFAFEAGETATNYNSLFPGNSYEENGLQRTVDLDIFVLANKNNEVLEVRYWE